MPDGAVSLVLLAGGVGKRMGVSNLLAKVHAFDVHAAACCHEEAVHPGIMTGCPSLLQAPIPKQYLKILGQPIATYSLQTFASMREIGEIVVVCEEDYR